RRVASHSRAASATLAARSYGFTDGSVLELDFDEHHFARTVIDHIVLDAGVAEIGFADLELCERNLARRADQLELAIARRHDDIVVFVAVIARGGAGCEAPLGHAKMIVVDLDGRSGLLLAHVPLLLSLMGADRLGTQEPQTTRLDQARVARTRSRKMAAIITQPRRIC